jgi:formate hydrogenlyase subunit 3/multisubunit Na+/H+ antiporter MnhD subunit
LFFLFIVVVTFGMGNAVFRMTFGDSDIEGTGSVKPALSAYLPQIVLLAALVIAGINMPNLMNEMLSKAAAFISSGPAAVARVAGK